MPDEALGLSAGSLPPLLVAACAAWHCCPWQVAARGAGLLLSLLLCSCLCSCAAVSAETQGRAQVAAQALARQAAAAVGHKPAKSARTWLNGRWRERRETACHAQLGSALLFRCGARDASPDSSAASLIPAASGCRQDG